MHLDASEILAQAEQEIDSRGDAKVQSSDTRREPISLALCVDGEISESSEDGDLEPPGAALLGHNGGGPGYCASAFHLPSLAGRRVTLCAMAVDDYGDRAERIVFKTIELLEGGL